RLRASVAINYRKRWPLAHVLRGAPGIGNPIARARAYVPPSPSESPQRLLSMSVFEAKDFDHHEAVAFFDDKATRLKAIIAIHSTALGPACGGTRVYPYASGDAALTDVLRLSRGM